MGRTHSARSSHRAAVVPVIAKVQPAQVQACPAPAPAQARPAFAQPQPRAQAPAQVRPAAVQPTPAARAPAPVSPLQQQSTMAALKAATQFARAAAAQAANAPTMQQAEPRSPTSPAAQQFMHQVHAAAAALFAAQAAAQPTTRTTQKPQQAMRPQQQQAALPQQQHPQRVQPARPARPVASHPDDAFFTGAWMFDASSAPAWLAAELAPRARGRVVTVPRKPAQAHATVSVSVRHRTSPARPEDPDVGFTSGAWLFDASAAPAWMQAQLPKVPKTQATQTPRPVSAHPQTAHAAAAPTAQSRPATATPTKMSWAAAVQAPRAVREDPDDAFNTGAWMFDASRVPAWMGAQLPKSTPAASKRNARAAK